MRRRAPRAPRAPRRGARALHRPSRANPFVCRRAEVVGGSGRPRGAPHDRGRELVDGGAPRRAPRHVAPTRNNTPGAREGESELKLRPSARRRGRRRPALRRGGAGAAPCVPPQPLFPILRSRAPSRPLPAAPPPPQPLAALPCCGMSTPARSGAARRRACGGAAAAADTPAPLLHCSSFAGARTRLSARAMAPAASEERPR